MFSPNASRMHPTAGFTWSLCNHTIYLACNKGFVSLCRCVMQWEEWSLNLLMTQRNTSCWIRTDADLLNSKMALRSHKDKCKNKKTFAWRKCIKTVFNVKDFILKVKIKITIFIRGSAFLVHHKQDLMPHGLMCLEKSFNQPPWAEKWTTPVLWAIHSVIITTTKREAIWSDFTDITTSLAYKK